jgi:FkbM family methyltransferase
MNYLEKCFEKHSFEDLNNGDYGILYNAIAFYIQLFGLKEDGVFFDIGCNAGSFVKVLQNFKITTNITCFEPHPIISKKTKELYPYITMNEYCIGNIDGYIDMYFPMWSCGLSSIINRPVFSELNQEITKLNIECKTLDKYCELNNIDEIDFIKIDVEGGEKTIFEGASRMLSNKKVKCGIFEIGQTLYDAGTNEIEIVEILEKYGYKINKMISQNDYVFYLP